MNYLLFDIGGTKTRLAVSRDGNTFEEPLIIETPRYFNEGIEVISEAALKLCDNSIDKAIGGIAGSLNREKTGLYRAPNLLDWEQKNFVEELSAKLDCKILIENDTAIVGLGEAVAGAGQAFNIVVYITISTGVNGVKISSKKIDENVFGFEIGHQILDVSTHLDRTESKGEFESFVSGREVEKRLGKPSEVENEQEWRKIAQYAAVGIFNTTLHWSPEVIILGGIDNEKNSN